MSPDAPISALSRDLFDKVLRDLARLPPKARAFDVQVAIWHSVTRHARAASAEQIAEITWQVLRSVSAARNAA
jgi:hypothetical protein